MNYCCSIEYAFTVNVFVWNIGKYAVRLLDFFSFLKLNFDSAHATANAMFCVSSHAFDMYIYTINLICSYALGYHFCHLLILWLDLNVDLRSFCFLKICCMYDMRVQCASLWLVKQFATLQTTLSACFLMQVFILGSVSRVSLCLARLVMVPASASSWRQETGEPASR